MKILLCVDLQRDFFDLALRNEEAIRRKPKMIEKIKKRANEDYCIIFTKDTHDDNYLKTFEGKNLPIPHCIKGTEGWNIDPEIYTAAEGANIQVVEKNTFGYVDLPFAIQAAYNKKFEDFNYLEEIEIIGLVSSICVAANACLLRAHYPWLPITVDASCCAGLTKEDHDAAMLVMKCQQINIIGEEH